MKKQINFRAAESTFAKIEELVSATGMSKTELISQAIDRMYREEIDESYRHPGIVLVDKHSITPI